MRFLTLNCDSSDVSHVPLRAWLLRGFHDLYLLPFTLSTFTYSTMATQDFPYISFLQKALPFFLILGAIYIIYIFLVALGMTPLVQRKWAARFQSSRSGTLNKWSCDYL